MGGVCGTHDREVHTGSWFENIKESDHLEHLDLNGMILQK
jgi:hypothetical protein